MVFWFILFFFISVYVCIDTQTIHKYKFYTNTYFPQQSLLLIVFEPGVEIDILLLVFNVPIVSVHLKQSHHLLFFPQH